MSLTRRLCRLEDIRDGEARGFPPGPGGFTGLVAVRRGDAVHVYVNSCPHIGIPLESLPDRFLDGPRRHLVCTAHGARFRVEDGFCVAGPCAGDSLEAVEVRIEDGAVLVPEDAGL
ncbi:Rieske (2Fe-2S) protein [Roseomonas sp. SSH11]|uniref:Rieske (2Fe-2S) protein n=1 Tax=Pararoseomonas baculiformis TaxID=2820812 RepID=A0ABS4A9P1_9PROT|nr:Rieske (2Fe-2S) protein [Pararoseomonas baculiformis]MBP0443305.1 Rieske (2Fe-2S) protein [Pararoseomonas baculiformis]